MIGERALREIARGFVPWGLARGLCTCFHIIKFLQSLLPYSIILFLNLFSISESTNFRLSVLSCSGRLYLYQED